jgi:hypothetical protein
MPDALIYNMPTSLEVGLLQLYGIIYEHRNVKCNLEKSNIEYFCAIFFLKFALKSWYADIFLLYYKIGCMPSLEHNYSFCSLDQGKRYYFAIIHYMCCFHLLMFIPVISDVCVTF